MEKMIRGKSILNPYATPYVPLSKLSTGMSYEKAYGANYSSYDNKRTDDLSAEYQLPESVSVDYDIQCFEKLNISGESSSNPSQQYFSVNVLHDDFAEYENRNVISNQSTMLESLSSIFPDISIESLAELLGANNGDLNETIDVLQQLECEDDGNEYTHEVAEVSNHTYPASAWSSGSSSSM